MPASRSVVSVLLRALADVSLHPQGRPCGRPPAALRPGDDTTVTEGDDEIGRASLHDAEGKMRHPSALDHPRALQIDRPDAEMVEQ